MILNSSIIITGVELGHTSGMALGLAIPLPARSRFFNLEKDEGGEGSFFFFFFKCEDFN